MTGNIEDMNHRQLHDNIQNAVDVIRSAEAGSSAYTTEQVEQARQQQQDIADYLEQVGPARIALKDLDTNQLLTLLKSA